MENIQIKELEGFSYLSFYGFGASPELTAIEKLRTWMDQNKSVLEHSTRFFGFNNPDPMPGSENYGYEIWVTIPSGKEAQFEDAKRFNGGLYAVNHCDGKLDEAEQFIPAAWKQLTAWLESSPYQLGRHQWLEEHLGGGKRNFIELLAEGRMSMDLYMPIVK